MKDYITLVSGRHTPKRYRYLDGKRVPFDRNGMMSVTHEGLLGYCNSIPGFLTWDDEDDPVWEMTDHPPQPVDNGPEWAQRLAKQLDEIKRLLDHRCSS